VRAYFAAGRPVGTLGNGVRALLDAGVLSGRSVAAPTDLRADLAAAGAIVADLGVCTDTGLVTARSNADIPAWTEKLLDVFAEGAHPLQRRSVQQGNNSR